MSGRCVARGRDSSHSNRCVAASFQCQSQSHCFVVVLVSSLDNCRKQTEELPTHGTFNY